jgi:hypothetical protein
MSASGYFSSLPGDAAVLVYQDIGLNGLNDLNSLNNIEVSKQSILGNIAYKSSFAEDSKGKRQSYVNVEGYNPFLNALLVFTANKGLVSEKPDDVPPATSQSQ